MKKLIAILVVFAVFAGAAFAQDGSWSIGGNGTVTEEYSFISGHNSQSISGTGSLDINYEKGFALGTIKAGLNFNQDLEVGASLEVTGDGFFFKAAGSDLFGTPARGDLFGNFTIGNLFLQASYAGGDTGKWNVLGDDNILGGNKVDGGGHFLLNYTAGSAELGIFIKDFDVYNTIAGVKLDAAPLALALQYSYGSGLYEGSAGLVTGIYSNIRAQVKFDIMEGLWAGLDFGAAFTPVDIALGLKVAYSGPISASLTFKGLDTFDVINLDASLGFDYAADPLAIGIGVDFASTIAPSFEGKITIKPYAKYTLKPDYLLAKLGAEIGIGFTGTFTWSITPGLYYNFLGTGTTDSTNLGDDYNTGFYVQYTVGDDGTGGGVTDKITTGFKWSF